MKNAVAVCIHVVFERRRLAPVLFLFPQSWLLLSLLLLASCLFLAVCCADADAGSPDMIEGHWSCPYAQDLPTTLVYYVVNTNNQTCSLRSSSPAWAHVNARSHVRAMKYHVH